MKKLVALIAVMFAVVLLICTAAVAHSQERSAEKVFQGQLVKVDIDAKTFSAMDAGGRAMVFNYTDETVVLGADKIQELTGKNDVHMRVSYADHAGKYIATKIQIVEKNPRS